MALKQGTVNTLAAECAVIATTEGDHANQRSQPEHAARASGGARQSERSRLEDREDLRRAKGLSGHRLLPVRPFARRRLSGAYARCRNPAALRAAAWWREEEGPARLE